MLYKLCLRNTCTVRLRLKRRKSHFFSKTECGSTSFRTKFWTFKSLIIMKLDLQWDRSTSLYDIRFISSMFFIFTTSTIYTSVLDGQHQSVSRFVALFLLVKYCSSTRNVLSQRCKIQKFHHQIGKLVSLRVFINVNCSFTFIWLYWKLFGVICSTRKFQSISKCIFLTRHKTVAILILNKICIVFLYHKEIAGTKSSIELVIWWLFGWNNGEANGELLNELKRDFFNCVFLST